MINIEREYRFCNICNLKTIQSQCFSYNIGKKDIEYIYYMIKILTNGNLSLLSFNSLGLFKIKSDLLTTNVICKSEHFFWLFVTWTDCIAYLIKLCNSFIARLQLVAFEQLLRGAQKYELFSGLDEQNFTRPNCITMIFNIYRRDFTRKMILV